MCTLAQDCAHQRKRWLFPNLHKCPWCSLVSHWNISSRKGHLFSFIQGLCVGWQCPNVGLTYKAHRTRNCLLSHGTPYTIKPQYLWNWIENVNNILILEKEGRFYHSNNNSLLHFSPPLNSAKSAEFSIADRKLNIQSVWGAKWNSSLPS